MAHWHKEPERERAALRKIFTSANRDRNKTHRYGENNTGSVISLIPLSQDFKSFLIIKIFFDTEIQSMRTQLVEESQAAWVTWRSV